MLSLRMISVIYTQQVQKGRCKKTQSSFFTSPSSGFIDFFGFLFLFSFFFFPALRHLFTGFRLRFGSAKYQKKSQKKCQKDLHKNMWCPFAPSFDTFFVISFVKTGTALSIRYQDNPAATDYLFYSFFGQSFRAPPFFLFTF